MSIGAMVEVWDEDEGIYRPFSEVDWLMVPLTARTKRDELLDLLDASPGYGFTWPDKVMTKSDIRAELERQRRIYWDDIQHKEARTPITYPGYTSTKPSGPDCVITAEECNAWLRTLPEPEEIDQ